MKKIITDSSHMKQ